MARSSSGPATRCASARSMRCHSARIRRSPGATSSRLLCSGWLSGAARRHECGPALRVAKLRADRPHRPRDPIGGPQRGVPLRASSGTRPCLLPQGEDRVAGPLVDRVAKRETDPVSRHADAKSWLAPAESDRARISPSSAVLGSCSNASSSRCTWSSALLAPALPDHRPVRGSSARAGSCRCGAGQRSDGITAHRGGLTRVLDLRVGNPPRAWV